MTDPSDYIKDLTERLDEDERREKEEWGEDLEEDVYKY